MIVSFPLRERMDMKEIIQLTLKAGYRGVEISPKPTQKSRQAFLEVKQELESYEQITVHYPLHSKPGELLYSSKKLEREIGINKLIEEIEFVAQFNPEIYVIHTPKAYSPTEHFKKIRDACQEHGMRLNLENLTSPSRNNLEEVRRICKLLNVGMTLDIGHAFITKQNLKELNPIKDVIEHAHLHNVNKKDDHQGLSQGFLPLPQIIQALKKIEYDKTIVLEIHHDPHFKKALKESKKILDLLWEKF